MYYLSKFFVAELPSELLLAKDKFAQSKADFINKMYIALKEANETKYWIRLLHDSGFVPEKTFNFMNPKIEEIISILAAIVKTSKIKS